MKAQAPSLRAVYSYCLVNRVSSRATSHVPEDEQSAMTEVACGRLNIPIKIDEDRDC